MNFQSFSEFRRQTEQALDLKNFFPVGCDYHWDGMGAVPVPSHMLKTVHASITDVCASCPKRECSVRQTDCRPKR